MSGAGRADARRTCSRTSGSSSSTTCRPRSSARSPSSPAAATSPQRYGFGVDVRIGLVRRRPRRRARRAPGRAARAPGCSSSTPPTTRWSAASTRSRRRTRSPTPDRAPRGHPEGAGAARGAEGPRRRRDRHLDAQRPRAPRPAGRRSSRPRPRPRRCRSSIVSFGFKHGLPLDVDLVFDCRFLPNPHWVDELRPLDGRDAAVRRLRAWASPRRQAFLDELRAAVRADAPGVRARGQVVPLDRGRLHRRPPPQRRDRRGARRRSSPSSGTGRTSGTGTWNVSDQPVGPAVVALGGGHGLATTLRAVRRYAGESPRSSASPTTAARPAGSAATSACSPSATCASASSRSRPTTRHAVGRRRSSTGSRPAISTGHALGNLLLVGLAEATGRLRRRRSPRPAALLGAVGRVPARRPRSRSCSRPTSTAVRCEGQVAVQNSAGRIRRVALVPADAPSPPAVARRDRSAPTRSCSRPGRSSRACSRRCASPSDVPAALGGRPRPGRPGLQPRPAGARDRRARRRRPPPGRARARRPGRPVPRATPDAALAARRRPRSRASESIRSVADVARPDVVAHASGQTGEVLCRSAGVASRPDRSTSRESGTDARRRGHDGTGWDQRIRPHRTVVHPGAARRGAATPASSWWR